MKAAAHVVLVVYVFLSLCLKGSKRAATAIAVDGNLCTVHKELGIASISIIIGMTVIRPRTGRTVWSTILRPVQLLVANVIMVLRKLTSLSGVPEILQQNFFAGKVVWQLELMICTFAAIDVRPFWMVRINRHFVGDVFHEL